MSSDEVTTSPDHEAGGMVFGRPPTRPGYRNDAATGDGSEMPESPDGAMEDGAVADPPVLDASGAEGTGTVETLPREERVDVDSSEAVDPPEGLDPPETEPAPVVTPELDHAATEDAPAAPPVDGDGAEVGVDPEPEAPFSPSALDSEPALDVDQVADLRSRWAEIQTGFVDDPRRAVEVADDIVAEAVGALQAAIDGRRRAMAEPWQDDADASTDALLTAFQGYRALFDRVLSV